VIEMSDLKNIDFNKVEIPKLATGSVVPPHIEYMMMKEAEKKRLMRRERWIGYFVGYLLGIASSITVFFILQWLGLS